MSLAASLVPILLSGASARGEGPEAASPPAIDGKGGAIQHPTARSEARDETPGRTFAAPPLEHRSILLDLGTLRPTSAADAAFVNEVAPEEECPGSLIHTYRGLEAVAVRRILGYYAHVFQVDTAKRWAGTNDSPFDMDQRIRDMVDAQSDLGTGGRWWERTWRQSLTPQLGGAPSTPRVQVTGEEIELFHLGELSITNEGRVKVGRLSLYLDDDRIYQQIEQKTRDTLILQVRARLDANLARVATPPDRDRAEKTVKAPGVPEESHPDAALELTEDDALLELERVLAGTSRERARPASGKFETPKGSLYTGDGWNLSLHTTFHLRVPDSTSSPEGAISTVAAELDLNLYPGETRQLFGYIAFKASCDPHDRNAVMASVELDIFRW